MYSPESQWKFFWHNFSGYQGYNFGLFKMCSVKVDIYDNNLVYESRLTGNLGPDLLHDLIFSWFDRVSRRNSRLKLLTVTIHGLSKNNNVPVKNIFKANFKVHFYGNRLQILRLRFSISFMSGINSMTILIIFWMGSCRKNY